MSISTKITQVGVKGLKSLFKTTPDFSKKAKNFNIPNRIAIKEAKENGSNTPSEDMLKTIVGDNEITAVEEVAPNVVTPTQIEPLNPNATTPIKESKVNTNFNHNIEADDLLNKNIDDFNDKEIWHTNFKQIDTEDDVKGLIGQVSETIKEDIVNVRGGIQKDTEVQKLADSLGTDVHFVSAFLESDKAGFKTAEEVVAIRKVVNKSAGVLHELAKKVSQSSADGTLDSTLNQSFIKQLALHQQLTKQFMGARADVGRMLRAMGTPTPDMKNNRVDEMLSQLGTGLDIDTLAKQIASTDTTAGITQMSHITDTIAQKGANVFRETYINSLLSGVKTQIINTTGAVGQLGLHIIDTKVASLLGRDIPKGTEKVISDEWKAGIYGLMYGFDEAIGVLKRVMKTAEPYGGIEKDDFTHQKAISSEYLGLDGAVGTAVDFIGEAVRTPTSRVMGGIDGFMKKIAERQVIAQASYRKVMNEADHFKWSEDRIKSRLTDLITNPPKEILEEAQTQGLYVTFQTKGGDTIQALSRLKNKSVAMTVITPFINTPVNLLKQGFLDRTPLGLLSKNYQEQIAKGGATKQMAQARMIVGTSILTGASFLAMSGNITGGLSQNYKVRKAQEEAGIQPYSFKYESNGNTEFISYKRFEPIAYILSAVADISEILKIQAHNTDIDESVSDKIGDYVGALSLGLFQATADRTYFKGLMDFAELMKSDNPRKMEHYLANFVNGATPFAGLRRDLTHILADEDTKKWSDGILAELRKNTPILNEDLPKAVNGYGEDIEYKHIFFNPFPTTTQSKINVVQNEIAHLSDYHQDNPIRLPYDSIGGIRLNAQQHNRYIKLARKEIGKEDNENFVQVLSDLIKSDEYKNEMTMTQKFDTIRKITNDFDTMAKHQLLEEDKELLIKTKRKEALEISELVAKDTGNDTETEYNNLMNEIKADIE